jgi:hypothetical protein
MDEFTSLTFVLFHPFAKTPAKGWGTEMCISCRQRQRADR